MDNKDTQIKKTISSIIEHKKKIVIGTSITALLIAGGTLVYASKIEGEVNSWQDKIYPGIQAYGIDLGGKTEEEAVEILNNQLISAIGDKEIIVTVGDKQFELKYSDIEPSISTEETVDAALEYGKEEGILKKNSMIKNGADFDVETVLSYNKEKLKEFENKIDLETRVNASNAKISIDNGQINIIPDVDGKKINVEELDQKLIEAINPDPTSVENISVELNDYKPEITAESLSKIDGKISGYTDTYNNDGSGRVTNMEMATGYINGTILMPGQEFSYNKTIGETTEARGYKEANTYVGGEVVPGFGGGVCQVSTALYRAAMRAGLKSTIRYNHSMMVGYSAASLDATVAEGDIDYRFVNTYDFPIYIQGYISGGTLGFNIYGNVEEMAGKSYELVNEVTEKLDYTTEYVDDPTLVAGTEVVKMNGAPGYKSKGYLVTYQNGVEVSRELVSNDTYLPMNKIVRRGTKKVEQPEPKPQTNTTTGGQQTQGQGATEQAPSNNVPNTNTPSNNGTTTGATPNAQATDNSNQGES